MVLSEALSLHVVAPKELVIDSFVEKFDDYGSVGTLLMWRSGIISTKTSEAMSHLSRFLLLLLLCFFLIFQRLSPPKPKVYTNQLVTQFVPAESPDLVF